MLVDPERVARAIVEVAAAEIMPRFGRLAAGDIREKSPGDLVTLADEAAERALEAMLAVILPGAPMIGEEATAKNPRLLDYLAEDGPAWLVDPVDGTGNFAAGQPAFAVMVAFVVERRAVASWLYFPVGGEMLVASAGEGAWLDGQRLTVAPAPGNPAELTGTLLAGFHGNPELGRQIARRRDRVRALRSERCAGWEYRRLAGGDMHFSLFSRLMPWDHAPGVLAHREAGGYAAYLDGAGYRPARIDTDGLLLAPDEKSWKALHDLLLKP
jgi:fructose-1,6-bisphosphatase/inositol monophosphatase family enzyme